MNTSCDWWTQSVIGEHILWLVDTVCDWWTHPVTGGHSLWLVNTVCVWWTQSVIGGHVVWLADGWSQGLSLFSPCSQDKHNSPFIRKPIQFPTFNTKYCRNIPRQSNSEEIKKQSIESKNVWVWGVCRHKTRTTAQIIWTIRFQNVIGSYILYTFYSPSQGCTNLFNKKTLC